MFRQDDFDTLIDAKLLATAAPWEQSGWHGQILMELPRLVNSQQVCVESFWDMFLIVTVLVSYIYIYIHIHDLHYILIIYIYMCVWLSRCQPDVRTEAVNLDFKVKPSECSWQLDQVIMVIRELAETDWWTHGFCFLVWISLNIYIVYNIQYIYTYVSIHVIYVYIYIYLFIYVYI